MRAPALLTALSVMTLVAGCGAAGPEASQARPSNRDAAALAAHLSDEDLVGQLLMPTRSAPTRQPSTPRPLTPTGSTRVRPPPPRSSGSPGWAGSS